MDVRPMGARIREHRHYAAILDGFRTAPLKGKARREHGERMHQLLAETGIDYGTVMRVILHDKNQPVGLSEDRSDVAAVPEAERAVWGPTTQSGMGIPTREAMAEANQRAAERRHIRTYHSDRLGTVTIPEDNA